MKEEKIKSYLVWIGALFMIIFCLSPFVWMGIVSFSKSPEFLTSDTPFSFTLQNYKDIIFDRSLHFPDYLRNSIIISAIVAVFATIVASLSAYAVSRLDFPGKIVIPMSMLALSMFPQISVVGYLFKMMTHLGWINTYNALIFPYIAWSLPLALWITLSYFAQIPIDLDKAALVDGATRFQALRKIILPVAAPGIFSTLILIFIFSFNEFLFALMLTVDYSSRTIPVGIALFQGLHGELPWGQIMAASTVSSIPLVLLTIIFQHRIIQGLTAGAIKG